MKKLITMLCLCFTVLSLSAQIKIHAGVGMSSASSTDFENFHISDHESYTVAPLGGVEGRVAVNLGDKDPAGMALVATFGASYALGDALDAVLDAQYGLGDLGGVSIYTGVNWKLVNGDAFKLGLTPMVGYQMLSADFGEIEIVPGTTGPVILSQGTFSAGDALTMEMSGLAVVIGITPEFSLSDAIGIRMNVGYQLSFSADPILMAGDVELPMDANGVVKEVSQAEYFNTDGTVNTNNAADYISNPGLAPTVSSQGLVFSLGVTYTM
jgi:hypothetical protein